MQLWVLGRAAYPQELEKNGGWPYVSSSDVPLSDRSVEDPKPRPLSIPEIHEYAALYKQAAHNAVHLAGFDGVEVHGLAAHYIMQSETPLTTFTVPMGALIVLPRVLRLHSNTTF